MKKGNIAHLAREKAHNTIYYAKLHAGLLKEDSYKRIVLFDNLRDNYMTHNTIRPILFHPPNAEER